MTRPFNRTFLIATAATAILLSGCAYPAYRADVAYVPAYYDGLYGPYWDGYWGVDVFFYFSDAHGHRFRRDDGHHFRHDGAPGYHGIARGNGAGGMRGFRSHAFTGAGHGGPSGERRG